MAFLDLNGLRRFKNKLEAWKPSGRGNAGQVLTSNGDGTTSWQDRTSAQEISDAVDAWMDDNGFNAGGTPGESASNKVNKPTSSPNGTAGQFLQTNGDGTTAWADVDDGLSEDAKLALLQLASKVVYIDDGGETYYNALYNAFYGNAPVPTSITAVFTPGNRSFVLGTPLSEFKQYLVVTVTYSNGSTKNVTNYVLSGTLRIGSNTVTVNYGNQSTTFTVTIASELPPGYTQIEYINSAEGYADTGVSETEAVRAVYTVQVSNVFYTKGNHILSAMNTFFPYLSGSNASGDYSQIRAKLKGSETIASGSASYTWSKNTTYTLEGFVGNSNDVILDGTNMFSITAGSTVSSSSTFLLFATQVNPADNGYRFHGRLYSMKIYGTGNTLLRNYIPCVNSSNVAGVYDTVTQTFLSSANQNSAFIAGPVV